MFSVLLSVLLAQAAVPSEPLPAHGAGAALPVAPVPSASAAPQRLPVLLIAGLTALGVGIAAQTVDVLLWAGPANPRAQGLLGLAVVPLVGSALFGFSGLGDPPLAAFHARAFAWLGLQTVGTVLSLLWGFVDEAPAGPTVAVTPVPGGWAVAAGHRF
jgi:hypothetical protein